MAGLAGSAPREPQSLVIVGAGSLGLAFGAALAASGQSVTILARAGAVSEIVDAGEIEVDGNLTLRARVFAGVGAPGRLGVVGSPQQLPPAAGTIFTTKGQHLDAAVHEVSTAGPGATGAAWVAGLQNGVIKDDILARAFGAGHLVSAATVLNARRTGAAQVSVGSLGMSYVGEVSGPPSDRVRAVCAAFEGAGLPAMAVDDGRSLVWAKFANAVAIFAVTSLTRLPTGEMWRHRPLALAYHSLLQEVDAVARAEGVTINDYPGLSIRSFLNMSADELAQSMAARPYDPLAPPSLSSMLQDITAQRGTEVDQVFGDLARRGRHHGVPTPRADLVNDLISGLEATP